MDVNPYRSPESDGSRPFATPGIKLRIPFFAFLVGAFAYHLFVWILLRSAPVDQQAGMLLLINSPVFAAWGIAIWLGRRHFITLGLLACGVQCMIASVMVLRGVGDWQITVVVNVIILIALGGIVAICWSHRPHVAALSTPSDVTKRA